MGDLATGKPAAVETSGPKAGPGFVHLRVHSAYSLLEGALPLKKILSIAAADEQPAIAITDTNNLFVALEFAQKAIYDGIQPIIGCQMSIDMQDATENDRRSGVQASLTKLPSLILLASTEAGYDRLMELVSRAYLDGEGNQAARIRLSWLEEGTEGLIALTGASTGPSTWPSRKDTRLWQSSGFWHCRSCFRSVFISSCSGRKAIAVGTSRRWSIWPIGMICRWLRPTKPSFLLAKTSTPMMR